MITSERFIEYLLQPKTEKIEARIPLELSEELRSEYNLSSFGSFSSFMVWKICNAPQSTKAEIKKPAPNCQQSQN